MSSFETHPAAEISADLASAGPSAAAEAAIEARLLAWRPQFPILADSTYLISNSLGAMPEGVRPALENYAETWATQGVRAWESDWWTLAGQVGDAIGAILGASVGTVSTHQNVTVASAVLASCMDYEGARNRIVCSELNFPSIIYLYREQERHGAELHLVPSADGFTVDTEAMLEAIDERTLLVPLSHVIYRSSYVQDVRAIIARAHEVGAMVAVDVYQSAGIMPIDLEAWNVDFAVGGVLKWLCGGPGVAYLYVRQDHVQRLQPRLTGWFAKQDSFGFDPRSRQLRDDAGRFMNGTTHIPSLTAAVPGLEILGQLDIGQVRRKSLRQTAMLIEAARERGWRVNTPAVDERRGGAVTVDIPDVERVTAGLLERRVMVDCRPGAGIRLAPHFYTTDDEIERALATIAELHG